MVSSVELDEALYLVEKKCTVEQIKAVLRLRRDDEDVRLSAESKEKLVQRNVRDAVNAGSIGIDTLFRLIRNAEENGAQHVWYYRPRSGIRELLTYENVAEQLWGKNWSRQVNLYPTLKLKPEDYTVSDFRKSETKPSDWYLKIYGHALVVTPTGKVDERGEGLFWKEFKKVPLRTVILIRWNAPDILEIRVDKNDSRKRLESWHLVAWQHLRAAIAREQMMPWDLSKTLKSMVTACEEHKTLYNFRDAGIFDEESNVLARFEALSDQGDLLKSQRTIDSIKSYVAEGGHLRGLAINFLSEKTSLESDLRVLVGTKDSNELLIPSHCSPGDVDHVTDQLRRFAKRSS